MGRWRPPAEKGTALVTPQGHARLKAELDALWRRQRPEVVKALAAAAAEGDRSENAEYTYRKKQLGEIDRRVRYLSKRLETLRVVDAPPSDPGAVFFGAMTYIGNGPNFMVKSIAESAGVKVPTFFGYVFKYSLPVLLPVLALVGWLFLR